MVHDLVASRTMRSIKFDQKKAVDKILRHRHYQFTNWWPPWDPLWCPWYTVQDVLRKLRMPEDVFFAIVHSDPTRFYTWEQNDEIWVCARKSRDQRGADLLLLQQNEPGEGNFGAPQGGQEVEAVKKEGGFGAPQGGQEVKAVKKSKKKVIVVVVRRKKSTGEVLSKTVKKKVDK